jgi:hypothetical protein
MTTSARVGLALLLTLAVGCKDKPAGKEQEGQEDEKSAQGVAGAPRSPARETKAPTAASSRTDALALLDRWVAAQTALEFDAYIAMYEPRTFRGVKRTAKGGVSDLAGWRADRKRMFDRKFEIAVEPLGIETWLDPGSKLKRGMSIVRFTQRWKSARYADHGVKVLHAWRSPDGKLLITYEDLLNSEAGWEDAVGTAVAIDLPVPANQAEALALWKKLAPTGEDHLDKLASIPADPAVRHPMARALLEAGDFACDQVVQYDECGLERREWKELDPAANLDQPCLRRRLAVWAITEAAPADLAALEVKLVEMAGLEAPEEDIPRALAVKVAQDGVPEVVELAIYEALLKADREEMIDVIGLSEAGLVAAAENGMDAAALALDPARHIAELGAAVSGEALVIETRREIFLRLSDQSGPAAIAAIKGLTDDSDCRLAMEAADELARRGDKSHLPARTTGQNPSDAETALCRLRHDGDDARRRKRTAEYMPREGVEIVQNTVGAIDPEEAGETTERVTEVDGLMGELDTYFDGQDRASDPGDLEFETGKDGGPILRSIKTIRWMGCDC